MIPVVTQTTAPFRERPSAKALGMGVSATATRGLTMSDWMQSRSTIAWSSGACSGETIRAPAAASASRLESRSCTSTTSVTIPTTSQAPAPATTSM